MLRQSSLRTTGLIVVCLLFVAAGLAVGLHPGRGRVSFDSVVEVWSSLFRDFDRFGLTITQVSSRREMEIGLEIAKDIEREYPGLPDTAQGRYVQEVGAALLRGVERKDIQYAFVLVRSTEINAFAIPGGHIYVTTGMLGFAQSEAELAAVLGHEISHVDLKHCIESLQYELAARQVAGDDIAAIAGIGYELLRSGFSKQ
jgi:predicted Zn-dependent protease